MTVPNRARRVSRAAALLLALLPASAVAQASATPSDSVPASDSVPPPTYVPHRVYDTRAARFTDFETMALDASRADVVFVGERHDDAGTHRLQTALLEGLERRGRAVVLSLEMFERDVQGTLDAYLAGRIPETELLAQSRPWPNYATDYRPLVERARGARWPVLAANAPRGIASRVAREGLPALQALPPAERAWVAAELHCPMDDVYATKFAAAMTSHAVPGTAAGDAAPRTLIQRLYEAQCVKDETMAETVAAAASGLAGQGTVVHMNGAFHSDAHLGTAERTTRRLPGATVLVISAIPVADLDQPDIEANAAAGDYLLFTLTGER
jgi:uncharacterized iron-regulated protein